MATRKSSRAGFEKKNLRGSVFDPNDHSGVVKEGYLQKKSSGIGPKRFQRRYFRIKGHYLNYCESEEADPEDVKGAIDLGNVKEVACKGTSGEFVIEMKPEEAGAKTSDTLLKAVDLAEAQGWVGTLETTITNLEVLALREEANGSKSSMGAAPSSTPAAKNPARKRRVSLASARRLGQKLKDVIGAKPTRGWKEDHANAVAEGMQMLGQDLADFPHRATPEALHEVCAADGTHQNKREVGFTEDEADCLESMELAPISLAIGKALQEKSDRFSAITYAAYEILARKGSEGMLAPKCYHFLEGAGMGLADEEPRFKQLTERPDERGYRAMTNFRPLVLRPADKGLYSPDGIKEHTKGTDPTKAENWKPMESTVICFESTAPEDGGQVVHSGIGLGGDVYALPPLTLLEVSDVQEGSFEYIPRVVWYEVRFDSGVMADVDPELLGSSQSVDDRISIDGKSARTDS